MVGGSRSFELVRLLVGVFVGESVGTVYPFKVFVRGTGRRIKWWYKSESIFVGTFVSGRAVGGCVGWVRWVFVPL